MDVDGRVEALEAECQRLRDRLEVVENIAGLGFAAPLEWGLTGSEMRVFGALMARDAASKDAIMSVLYRGDGRDEAEIKIVDVFVCKLRKKIKPFGIEIETIWGQGYRITPAMKDRVREAMVAGAAA